MLTPGNLNIFELFCRLQLFAAIAMITYASPIVPLITKFMQYESTKGIQSNKCPIVILSEFLHQRSEPHNIGIHTIVTE